MTVSPGFTIPDLDETSNSNPQSIIMQTDIDAVMNGIYETHVLGGCVVTAQGSPDMTVAVAVGSIASGGVKRTVAAGNVTIGTADGSNPRIDCIVSASDGSKHNRAGTAANNPKAPELTSGDVLLAMVLVRTATTSVISSDIIDKRLFQISSLLHQNYDFLPETPPASPNAMDDEFDDTAGMSGTNNGLNARWTWRNQGGASIAYGKAGWATVTLPQQSGFNWRHIEQALPGGDCTFECKVSLEGTLTNWVMGGISFINGTSGAFYTLSLAFATPASFASPLTTMNGWTDAATQSGDPASQPAILTWGTNYAYIRAIYVASTPSITVWVSHDGIGWTKIGPAFTDAKVATKVGLCFVESNNAGNTKVHFDYFRRTA